MIKELGTKNLGGILTSGFNIYLSNFISLFLLSLACNILSLFPILNEIIGLDINVPLINGYTTGFSQIIGSLENFGLVSIGRIISYVVLVGVISEFVSSRYLEKEASIKKGLLKTFSKFFRLIIVTILLYSITILGAILIIIPGIIFFLMYCLAPVCAIVEDTGILKSLKRSKELAKGYKGELFLIFALLNILFGVINNLINSALMQFDFFNVYIGAIASYLFTSAVTPLTYTILVIFYYDKKIRKEDFAIEHFIESNMMNDNR